MSDSKLFSFYTLGCKLNFAESSYLGKQLIGLGFRKAQKDELAHICIINTCSVTEVADKKCRQTIHKVHSENPNAYIIVTGCYAQLKPKEVSEIAGVNLVLGSNEKFDIDYYYKFLNEQKVIVRTKEKHQDINTFYGAVSGEDRTRFFLKIQDGCDYFCTYCTIPFARGKSRSGTITETLQLAQEAINNGAKEIILTGVNLGEFGKNNGESFYELIQKLDQLEGVERYRISSIEPNLLTDEIIDFIATSKKFTPHFHIPLQSGCDEVLKLMHRRYTTDFFKNKIDYIKTKMPDAFIGIDVIVGTRGETDIYFNKTVQFLENLNFTQLHVFTYSERQGTKALNIEYKVPFQEKKRRNEVLHKLSEQKRIAFYKQNMGSQRSVLWEESKRSSTMYGFTENYIRISAPYDKTKFNFIEQVVLGDFSDDLLSLKKK